MKHKRDAGSERVVGGVRNPARLVKLVLGLVHTGDRVSKLEPFTWQHSAVLQIADEFVRTNYAGPPETLVQAWREPSRQEL